MATAILLAAAGLVWYLLSRSWLVSEQVSGPVQVWVNAPALTQTINNPTSQNPGFGPIVVSRVPQFFGWGMTAPKPKFRSAFAPLKADPAGPLIQHDDSYAGQDATTTATMSIWDENLLFGMMQYVGGGAPGFDNNLDRGTLMVAEGETFEFWLVYPFAVNHKFFVTANMRQGYHFLFTRINGEVLREQGAEPNKLGISWYHYAGFVPGSAGVGAAAGAFAGVVGQGLNSYSYQCYNNDMSALVGRPITLNPRI